MATRPISEDQRQLGALWGSLVGDALGVPVEFRPRAELQRHPVRDMRAFGTHRQPAGTWSDDGSLLLCTAESLAECSGLDLPDLAARFVRWVEHNHWTPHGRVFDIGGATSTALARVAQGVAPALAGGISVSSNGNGSLMRLLPAALWFRHLNLVDRTQALHFVSAITHRHPRSEMACAFFGTFVAHLFQHTPADALALTAAEFRAFYTAPPYAEELPHFAQLLSGQLAAEPEDRISGSGYVIHTLTASIWCLLTTQGFSEAVLRAVNLGEDTDTTGCVTGGLAGLLYGYTAIPPAWIAELARRQEIEVLFQRFLTVAEAHAPRA